MGIRPRSKRATLAALAAVSSLALAPVIATADGGGGVGTGGGGGGGKDDDGSYAFPVDGKHSYGDGFGAGRGHEGQDLLADCREHVVASNAGRVRKVDTDDAAGNYLVLRERGEDTDSVYMHLLKDPFVKVGDKVEAGEKIGLVGSTGSSSACHLHYEFWTAPGWYEGGRAKNPEPMLRKWDRQG